MNTFVRHLRLLFSVVFALCILAPSAKADTACVAGSLSTLMGTTCDIGSLQFTFSSLLGGNSASNTQWSPSDFTLTPVTGGFTISLNEGAQTISTSYDLVVDFANLYFQVTDLDGDLAATSVTGATSETGLSNFDSSVIDNSAYGLTVPGSIFEITGQEAGDRATRDDNVGSPIPIGSDEFQIFDLDVQDGAASAYWGGSSTVTFDSVTPAATPEPSSLALLGSGALLFGAEIRRRYRTIH